MSKLNKAFIIAIITVFILVLGGIALGLHFRKIFNKPEDIDGGVTKEGRLKGYEENIKLKLGGSGLLYFLKHVFG